MKLQFVFRRVESVHIVSYQQGNHTKLCTNHRTKLIVLSCYVLATRICKLYSFYLYSISFTYHTPTTSHFLPVNYCKHNSWVKTIRFYDQNYKSKKLFFSCQLIVLFMHTECIYFILSYLNYLKSYYFIRYFITGLFI